VNVGAGASAVLDLTLATFSAKTDCNGFRVNQSEEDVSDFKGLRNVAMATKFWPKQSKTLTKMAITSVVCDINAEFGLRYDFS